MSDETKESMSEVDNVDENDDDGDKDEPSPPRKRARRHRTAPRITCNELKERIIKAESLLKNVYRVSIPPRVKGGFKRKVFLEARLKQLNDSMQQSKKAVLSLETMGCAEMGIINEFLFVSGPKQQTFHDMIMMIQQSQSIRQTSRRLYELYGLEFLRKRILEYRFTHYHFALVRMSQSLGMMEFTAAAKLLRQDLSPENRWYASSSGRVGGLFQNDNVLVCFYMEYDRALSDVGAICTSDKWLMLCSMFPQNIVLSHEDRICEQSHCLMDVDLPFHAQVSILIAECRAKKLRTTLRRKLASYGKRKGLNLETVTCSVSLLLETKVLRDLKNAADVSDEVIQAALDVINSNATAYQAACTELRDRLAAETERDKNSPECKALQCFLRRRVNGDVSKLRVIYVKKSSQLRAWPPNTPMLTILRGRAKNKA